MDNFAMKMGTARLCITPQKPLRLCGYASRSDMFDSVEEDLFLRVHIQRQGQTQLVFLYGDLLWWGTDFVENARGRIFEEFQILQESVFFVASHNHSGPPTGNYFTPLLETWNREYADFLLQTVMKGIRGALLDMEDVSAVRYDGKAELNVFRRVQGPDGIEMRPNYPVPADHSLTVLAFYRKDGSLKSCMVHYPCHANLSGDNTVQPDYPGVLLRLLDETYPGSVSLFLQGCTADLRPNSVLGDRFASVHYQQVCAFASRLHSICCRLLEGEGTPFSPGLFVSRHRVLLPFENRPTEKELRGRAEKETGVRGEWARKILERPARDAEPMEISYIHYAGELSLCLFNAEMSQYYAAFTREEKNGCLSVAYCNGMIGYICTASQIREGGYEPEGSALYFALPGTYSDKTEQIVQEAIRYLCKTDNQEKCL